MRGEPAAVGTGIGEREGKMETKRCSERAIVDGRITLWTTYFGSSRANNKKNVFLSSSAGLPANPTQPNQPTNHQPANHTTRFDGNFLFLWQTHKLAWAGRIIIHKSHARRAPFIRCTEAKHLDPACLCLKHGALSAPRHQSWSQPSFAQTALIACHLPSLQSSHRATSDLSRFPH